MHIPQGAGIKHERRVDEWFVNAALVCLEAISSSWRGVN